MTCTDGEKSWKDDNDLECEKDMEIHNYNPEIIDRYCNFLNRARMDRPDREDVKVDELRSFLIPPYYDPKGHFIALIENELVADISGSRNVGYMVFPPDTINFSLNVLPEYRKRGIGSKLLEIAFDYFKKKGMKVAVVDDVHVKCKGSIDFYKKKGFNEKTHSYWMECKSLSSKKLHPLPPTPTGYRIRSLNDRDELEVFRNTVNEAFSDTPNFIPLDKERFDQRYVNFPSFDLSGLFVAAHEASNSVVGSTASLIDIDRTKGDIFGHIKGVGVIKAHRGKGLGRLLTTHGINWVASHKITVARLGTSNPIAFKMYRSLNFEVLQEYIRFEKKVPN